MAAASGWAGPRPFFIQIAIGILVWVGLALRETRLQRLIPLRESPSRASGRD